MTTQLLVLTLFTYKIISSTKIVERNNENNIVINKNGNNNYIKQNIQRTEDNVPQSIESVSSLIGMIQNTLQQGHNNQISRGKVNKGKNNEFIPKIVGGVPVDLEKYPFSVQVYNMGNMCAGTILNSWTVLTAAHCFDVNKDLDEITVHVGSRYSFDLSAICLHIQQFIVHQLYNRTGLFSNDIALIFLASPIKFSKKVEKAILVNTDRWMDPNAGEFIVTGWGRTKYEGSISKLGLLRTYMSYVPLKVCSKLHHIKLKNDMFCLYGDGVRDTCSGDSGGGVLWNGMIVGITSHGDGCARKDSPSIYTNVWYFRKWIQKHVTDFVERNCFPKK